MDDLITEEQQAVKEVGDIMKKNKEERLNNSTSQAVNPAAKASIPKEEAVFSSLSASSNLIEDLAKQKRELLEIEQRINKTRAETRKEAEDLLLAGRAFAGQIQPEKTKEQIIREEAARFLKGTRLDPFEGDGAKAFE